MICVRNAIKGVVFALLGLASLAACAGVADLDVKYQAEAPADGGRPLAPSSTPDAALARTPVAPPANKAPAEFDAGDPNTMQAERSPCPCDESQGFGCCIADGAATCVSAGATCGSGKGASFFRCAGPDVEGSVCCLRRFEGLTEAALTATCDAPGASVVCSIDADCPNGGKCTLATCGGLSIGTCDGTPVCP